MNASQTVLVLDGHTNQALASVRSLARAGHRVMVASHVRWPIAAWSRHCSGQFHLRRENLEGYGRLRQQVAEYGVDWVLPLTERACILCNLDRTDWERSGIRIACAPKETLDRAFDKVATIKLAGLCGVNVPAYFVPQSLEEARQGAHEVGYPCVIKPRFSNAWDGSGFMPNLSCAYVAHPDELERQILSRRQGEYFPLVQACVPGRGKGVFALCDHGRVLAWFAHERLRDVRPSGSGSSLRQSIPLESRLREPAEDLLAQLRWHGPAMVEFRDDGVHAPWLMEVNGRFWNSLELAIQAGVDFPRLWLEVLNDRTVQPTDFYRTDVVLRWVWGDMKRLMYVIAGRPRGYTGAYPSLFEGLREVFGRQPPGTRPEVWQRDDPWPAVAEWVQGAREVLALAHR